MDGPKLYKSNTSNERERERESVLTRIFSMDFGERGEDKEAFC